MDSSTIGSNLNGRGSCRGNGKTTSRKRKREQDRNGGSNKHQQPPKSLMTTTLLLKGKRFSVSTRVASKNESSSEQCSSFNKLRDLCLAAGASFSSQVHRKVDAVIASPEAVEAPATQRVRKAWKLNIPVVEMDWIQECLETKHEIPIESYCHFPPKQSCGHVDTSSSKQTVGSRKGKKVKIQPDTDLDFASSTNTIEVDLGCCCICHDSVGEGVVTDCEWCTDCTVNQKNRSSLIHSAN